MSRRGDSPEESMSAEPAGRTCRLRTRPRPTIRRAGQAVLAAGALLAVLVLPARARAGSELWVSPGIKLAYTFQRGFTFGVEVSFIWWPEDWDSLKKRPCGLGFAINLDSNFKNNFKMRVGGQVSGPGTGLEAGPSLVRDKGRTGFGLGITAWAGLYVIPYYTYTAVFGKMKNLHELGTYLKLHINTQGDFGSRGHYDHDHDLD